MKPLPHPPSNRPSAVAAILRRIRRSRPGSVHRPAEFVDLGIKRNTVDQTLARLVDKGILRRLGRGLYDLPRKHPLLGTLLPTPDALTRTLTGGGSALRLQPSGAQAANLLGLTEQVPTRIAFLTDGASRRITVGPLEIHLRNTTPRNMATAGRISGTVIQALRHLGRAQVDDAVLARLRDRLSPEDRHGLKKDAGYAPAWIARFLLQLAED